MANDKTDPAVQQALLNISKQLETSLDKRLDKQERLVGDYTVALEKIKLMIEAEENLTKQQELKSQQLKLQETIAISTKALNRTKLEDLEKQVEAGIMLEGQAAQDLKDLKQKVKVYDQINKVAEKAPEYISNLFTRKGGDQITKGIGEISGSIKGKLTESLKTSAESATTAGGALKAMAGPAAVLAIFTIAAEIFSLAKELFDAESAFMKATGASQEFARSLSNSYEETRKFGATAAETSAAMQSLFTGFTDFTFQDAKTRESLTETATVLAKLGVSNQDFAASIQIMTKSMGMSADAAGQQMLNLEKFAEELGVAPSKLASDFAGAGNMMAKMGDQGVDAFKDLQIASKVTGLEMQKILNIVDKFDTFEGAATQAGKLNAALGGNFVNAMDLMMETDPAARFGMIRDSILDAGLSFDEMSYYQKKFYTESLGLSDVGDLALVLAGNMEAVTGELDKSSQSYEDAADRAKEVASFQEQLNMLFVELIPVVTPIIDAMRSLLSALQPLGPVLGGIGEVFKFVFSGVGKWLTFYWDLIAGINESLPILKALGVVIGIIGIAFAAWASPVFLVVGAIVALTSALGYLVDWMFHKRNSPTFFEGLGMMPDMFSDTSDGIDGTSSSMRGMSTTMESTPIPAAAETMAGTSNNGGSSTVTTSGGNGGMQTVRQPMEISLNGDKLEKFIVEVTGKFIKNVSLVQ